MLTVVSIWPEPVALSGAKTLADLGDACCKVPGREREADSKSITAVLRMMRGSL